MENIIMAVFPIESEAYQAFSELKRDPVGTNSLVSQAVLVKKTGASLSSCETFDTGVESNDDTWAGCLIGSCVGILAGPIGVLLGASLGTLAGAGMDAGDMVRNASLLEKISSRLPDGSVAILALAQEADNMVVDSKFMKFHAEISRYDAAEVQSEVDEALRLQREMEKQTKAALRAEKTSERKTKLEETRKKIADDFEGMKKKRKDNGK